MKIPFFGKKEKAKDEPLEIEPIEKPSLDELLNKEDFVKFLGDHPDVESLEFQDEDLDKVIGLHSDFETFQRAKSELSNIYIEEVEEVAEVKLGKEGNEALEGFFKEQAQTLPELLKHRLEQKDGFVEMQGRIREKESRLKQDLNLKDLEVESLLLKKIDLQQERERFTKFYEDRRTKSYAVEWLKSWFGAGKLKEEFMSQGVAQWTDEIAKTQQKEEALENILKMQEAFASLRKDFFQKEFLPYKGLCEIAKAKAQEEMREILTGKPSIDDLEDLQGKIDKFSELKQGRGFDYLADLKPEGFQETLDKSLTGQIAAEIATRIKTGRAGTLDAFEKSLGEYLTKDKIGSLTGEKIKTFLFETISTLMGDASVDKARKLLLKRVIIKYGLKSAGVKMETKKEEAPVEEKKETPPAETSEPATPEKKERKPKKQKTKLKAKPKPKPKSKAKPAAKPKAAKATAQPKAEEESSKEKEAEERFERFMRGAGGE